MQQTMTKTSFITLTEEQETVLSEQIKCSFINRTLYKGSAEVVNAIIDRRPITTVYLVGSLDPWYESSITKSLVQTENSVSLIRLDKKYQRLVYDIIKDLELKPKVESKIRQERGKSRRFFLTRAFAI